MFNFISHLFSSDPEKKEKRLAEKEERDRLRAQRKHDQRIASKQVLSDEWHPVNFPYQATIFWPKLEPYFTGKNVITYYADAHLRSLQATLKKNHIPEPEMRFIDLYDYFCERHDSWESLSLDSVAEKLDLDSFPSAKHPKATLDTITEILELMYEKRPGILKKLLGIKAKGK